MNNSIKPEKLYVFDLDHTLINCNCSFAFGLYLLKKKKVSIWRFIPLLFVYFAHVMGLISMQSLHTTVFKSFFYKTSTKQIDQLVDDFLKDHFNKMINNTIYSFLKNAQEKQYHTMILSSSPHFLVGKMAKLFKVDSFDSTVYSDKDSQFDKIDYVLEGVNKEHSLKSFMENFAIKKENVTAFTDSYLDLPLLQNVGTPIAVNPDSKLKKYAMRQGWKILS